MLPAATIPIENHTVQPEGRANGFTQGLVLDERLTF